MGRKWAYYNENDLKTAAWLRELIKQGLIADGEVDTRSIVDVQPSDLAGFVQCHFFAGIGGWSYALRLAGWSDERAVWTGSCPCQPFSSAGAQAGGADSRDLWPTWRVLIGECRPRVVFGEQVESAIGHGWLDRLHDDLEAEDYALGPIGLPSACVGAFDIRQRLWFVADTNDARPQRRIGAVVRERSDQRVVGTCGSSCEDCDWPCDGRIEHCWRTIVGELENAARERSENALHQRGDVSPSPRKRAAGHTGGAGAACDVADAESGGLRIDRRAPRLTGHVDEREPSRLMADANGGKSSDGDVQRGGRYLQQPEDPRTSFWADADWIECSDGKARAVEPGTFPLAHGIPARVGRLRGYGNAINPWVAAEVIAAYMEIVDEG